MLPNRSKTTALTDMARTIARPRMKTTTVTPMAPYRREARASGGNAQVDTDPVHQRRHEGKAPTRPTVTLTEAWGRIDRCHVRQLAEVSVLASDLPAVRIPNSPMATASHRVPWLCIRAALISTARPPETPASDASEVSNALPTNPASHVTNRAGAEALPVQPAEEGEHAGVVDGCDRGRREARQQVAVDDLWLPRVSGWRPRASPSTSVSTARTAPDAPRVNPSPRSESVSTERGKRWASSRQGQIRPLSHHRRAKFHTEVSTSYRGHDVQHEPGSAQAWYIRRGTSLVHRHSKRPFLLKQKGPLSRCYWWRG